MPTSKILTAAVAALLAIGLSTSFAAPPEGERERGPRDGARERGPRDGERGPREGGPRDGNRERGPRDGDREGPPRGDRQRPVFPLLQALDKNQDGVIDSGEIERAVAALKSLDGNSDGKLTREELMPNFAGMQRGGDRGQAGDRRPGGQRDGAGPGGGQQPGQRGNPAAMFDRMDKDGDGSLSEDEVPEQMRDKFGMVDADGDGAVSKQELVSAIERRMKAGGKGGNRGGNRDAAEGGEKPRRPPQKNKADEV